MGDIQIRRLSWAAFDGAIHKLTPLVKAASASHIYGMPRGGLPLAVALSHYTGLPLTFTFTPFCVWVDDVIETGATYEPYKDCKAAFVWVDKTQGKLPDNMTTVLIEKPSEWIVFPWEDIKKAEADAAKYYNL